ncbi:hypothetical protein SDRG_14714 [Saprolegnia diclina VS20]|uniref:Rubisco LSMT substrate-binding domain-containing protein n=1 Tax=Saprolegnia diclina (strain VS20) TaxID=1156394 RepID=T0PPY6_SAPDV|nr:hypothetical protein SDRG_14714 [Saprolegnia diclina VS20]EQC27514.1 hypothetical protein SDRG_14714 [Saprolegnia diclina VS20]|eukprot:XP_008619088.1 hypothetical protein SDRG_14714 [Saprolegnia diclina VS20]
MESPTKRVRTSLTLEDAADVASPPVSKMTLSLAPSQDTPAAIDDATFDDSDTWDVPTRLCKWLAANGADLEKLRIETYAPEVRGVHAKRPFSAGDRVMLIPLNCLITVEMGKATDIGIKIQHLEFGAPKHIFLMMYLLTDMELGNDSFFKPYYDSLPPTLHNLPVFWTDDELRWLQGSHILHQIRDRKATIARDYEAICVVDPAFRRFSLERFMWARMIVCSRNFGISVHGFKTAALVPYADMLNHYRPRETSWTFDDDANGFTITALHGIAAGNQVYDSYGKKCNHRFLLNYGFAVPDNTEEDGRNPNEVLFPLQLLENEPSSLFGKKQRYLHDSGVYSMDTRFSTYHGDANTREGLSFLRLIVATESEFDAFSVQTPAHAIPPISLENEVRVLKHIAALATVQLFQYATSLEQDMVAVAQCPVFSNQAQALHFIMGEKRVCMYYQSMAYDVAPLWTQPHDVIRARVVAEYEPEDDPKSRYVDDVTAFLLGDPFE